MQVKKYGLELVLLSKQDIELVRNWRNLPHVKNNMQYQETISAAMQQSWWQNLDKNTNLYFVIQSNTKKVGLVNLKDINLQLKTAEAGIFIGETEYLNSTIPVLATITIMELAFDVLKLKSLKAKIGVGNGKAVAFNEQLGYKAMLQQSHKEFKYYQTDVLAFKNAISKFRDTLNKLNQGECEIKITTKQIQTFGLNISEVNVENLKLTILP